VKNYWYWQMKSARGNCAVRQGSIAREARQTTSAKLENMFEQMAEGEVRTLSLIVKSDVKACERLHNRCKNFPPVSQGQSDPRRSGAISESDINLALASKRS